jgi:hypothetical protein
VVLPVLLLRHLFNRHHREPHATAALPLHSDSFAELATARIQYQGRCLHAAVLHVLQLLGYPRRVRSSQLLTWLSVALLSALARGLRCFRRVASRATLITLVITGVTRAQRTYFVCIRSIRTPPRQSTAPSRLLCRCCFIDGFALNRFPLPLHPLFSSVRALVHTPS